MAPEPYTSPIIWFQSPLTSDTHPELFSGVSTDIHEISCKSSPSHVDRRWLFEWAALQLTWGRLEMWLKQKAWKVQHLPFLWISGSLCFKEMNSLFFFLKKGVRSLRSQLYANTLLKKKALGESYLYPTGITHAKGEAVNLRISRSGCSHDKHTSLLFWWHTIPISNCQAVPGRRRHNHSVILERPCVFLSSRASWPELFLRLRFTTTLDPLVPSSLFLLNRCRTQSLKSHHMAHLLPFGFQADSWN